LRQAANYLCGFPRERGLTQGQVLQNPASRVTSVIIPSSIQAFASNSAFFEPRLRVCEWPDMGMNKFSPAEDSRPFAVQNHIQKNKL
jgi:hypothetical protein